MYRVAVVAALALVLASAAACSSDGGTAQPTTTTTTTSTSTTTTSTSTTTSTVPRTPAPSPQAAATTFVNAWRAGDRPLAATVAVPDAVDAAFGAEQPKSLENRGCNSPPPGSPVLCVYRTNSGNELQLRVAMEGDGWVVEQAIVSAAG